MISNIGILGPGKIGKSTFILNFMDAFNNKSKPLNTNLKLIEIDGFFETNKVLLSSLDLIVLMISYTSLYEANKIIDWYSSVKDVVANKPIIIIRTFKDTTDSSSEEYYKKFNNTLYKFYIENDIPEFSYIEINTKDKTFYKHVVDKMINFVN